MEVKYDDDVWYKGTLVQYDTETDEWVALFDEDGDQTNFQMKMYPCCKVNHLIKLTTYHLYHHYYLPITCDLH